MLYHATGEVSCLMKAQLLFGGEKEAAGLQTLLDTLLGLIDRSLAQIWDKTAREEGPAGQEATVSV